MEEATPTLEFRKTVGVVEAVLEGLVLGIAWRGGQEVAGAFGRSLVKRGDNVVVLGVVYSEVPKRELGFGLCKPDCRLFWSEGRQFEADTIDLFVLRNVVAAVCLRKLS